MTTVELESFRQWIYPFGFIASLLFGLRFLVQWIASERKRQSVVPPLFWYLSVAGNITLMLHTLVQLQFPVALLQSQHTIFSWRNINLSSPRPAKITTVYLLLILSALVVFTLFIAQQRLVSGSEIIWWRSIRPLEHSPPVWMDLIGILGIGAFSCRFWIQWWEAEKKGHTVLSSRFWAISLFGSFASCFYFFHTFDPVNLIGPLLSLVPYARNLVLLKKKKCSCDVVLVAGETSGDLIGEQIAHGLLQQKPSLALCGIAGTKMRGAGVKAWMQTESFQVMGIVDVLCRLPFLIYSTYALVRKILAHSPQCVIFIDQPSFSKAVAKRLRHRGFSGKIVQAVAPTVWAYKRERADEFARYFDLILPLFQVEKEFFADKLPTVWIGHPSLCGLCYQKSPTTDTLSLFPGSRPGEIYRNLALQLDTAAKLIEKTPSLRVAIAICQTASAKTHKYIRALASKKLSTPYDLVDFSDRYELMRRSKASIAKLGTVTLELALFEVPTVCCYQVNRFTQWWAETFLRLRPRLFALPNILYGEAAFPECVLPPVTADTLYEKIAPYVLDKQMLPADLREKLLSQIKPEEDSTTLITQAILSCMQ